MNTLDTITFILMTVILGLSLLDYVLQRVEPRVTKNNKPYKPVPHVERWTTCDMCKYLNDCIANGVVIDITHGDDNFSHYTTGLGSNCRLTDDVAEKFERRGE